MTLRASSIAGPSPKWLSKRRGNCLRATAKGQWTMGNLKKEFNCRPVRGYVLAVCLTGGCIAAGSPASAQGTSTQQESVASSRLLNAQEGRAIADAARDQDQPGRGAQDCSHLVHQTY